LLKRWGLECRVVTMETEDSDKVIVEGMDNDGTPHTIHIWEITRNSA